MSRLIRSLLVLILFAAWGHAVTPSVLAQTDKNSTPASSAEQIRSLLSQAQLAAISGTGADSLLAQARSIYDSDLRPTLEADVPAPAERITRAFADADTARALKDWPAFAAGQATIWTAILNAAYVQVIEAVQSGDAAKAKEWLAVREFRQATRFSRPDADATLALTAFGKGELDVEATVQAIRADLLDTYQARMEDAIRVLPDLYSQKFTVRLAQQASLADGYFNILSMQYGTLEGADKLAAAQAQFAALKQAGIDGKDPAPYLDAARDAITGFRAAPLTLEEQGRRAGQLLRYLSLVPIEYGRGVAGGRVTNDIEIQEAITFQNGATVALADLLNDLKAINADKAAEIERLMLEQTGKVNAAGKKTAVASHEEIQALTTQITALLNEIMPETWKKASPTADLDVIGSVLDSMEQAVAAGDYTLAESSRIEAYAILEVGPEARLRVFAPQLALHLENLFWYGTDTERGLAYLISNRAPLAEVKATRAKLDEGLKEAIAVVRGNNEPAAVATNAGIIVFREGLEAVLILASLLGSLKAGANRKFRKPIWWGVAVAFLATVLTFVLARGLLASLARYGEALEAVVSLVAIAVLLLITNWFFHKVYWTGWIANFHSQKKRLIGGETGQMLGLVILGFTSIYREGFETVLFLQALVLEAGIGSVLAGVAIGLAGTILVGIIVLALQAKLPYKKMLVVTGIMIGAVLLVMVGNTAHVMQVVGWLPAHTIPGLEIPFWVGTWFGIYPTWEGVLLQIVAGTFVVGSYFLAERRKDKRAEAPQSQATPNTPMMQAVPAASSPHQSGKVTAGK